MSFFEQARKLARKGFHVFPVSPGSKFPAIEEFPEVASNRYEKIQKFWFDPVMGLEQPLNIGISTSRFEKDKCLIVIDVDDKGDKRGSEELKKLAKQGFKLPKTYSQSTPTGGVHFVFWAKKPVKNGVDVLARGLDIRSKGGYIVGAGSLVPNGPYVGIDWEVAECPQWVIDRCEAPTERYTGPEVDLSKVDQRTAKKRALFFLENEAPIAKEGEGGDQTTFWVAARLRDFGLTMENAFEILAEEWNPHCQPPWDLTELERKVENAYRYGKEKPGVEAPEMQFDSMAEEVDPLHERDPNREYLHPFQKLNQDFSFVIAGGGAHILWEKIDEKGKEKLDHLSIQAFHQKFAYHSMITGSGKVKPVTELWMKSPQRRSYDGICFRPGLETPKRFYNLWRGFRYVPLEKGQEPTKRMARSVERFKEHLLENVCKGDEKLAHWLTGYFAHCIQKPWEKPLTALVFKGGKGVGKNALIERVGALLKPHFMVAKEKRYLVGNFNGHLENLLMLVLDEAYFAGDKQVEGVIKGMITGEEHVIEHKGKEPYSVDNRLRLVFLGNEDWIVPASHDERRFAVFNVGSGKKQQNEYFETMRLDMEAEGYRYLLRYLLDFDLSKINVNVAPQTKGLEEQKLESLHPIHEWWYQCLTEGHILESDFGGDQWPDQVTTERLQDAFRRYVKDRRARTYVSSGNTFSRMLRYAAPSVSIVRKRVDEDGGRARFYMLPDLEKARRQWDDFIGYQTDWEQEDRDELDFLLS